MNHSPHRWLAPILLASACTSSVVDDASSDKSAIQCSQNTAIQATFSDTADHWAGFAAEGLRDAGIVAGRYGRNDFEPLAKLTRAEWAAMLAKTIRKFPELLATEQWRTDQYVQDDALGPAGSPEPEEEACTEGGEASTFFGWRINDEGFDRDHWAYEAVCGVVSLGVMTGDHTSEMVNPEGTIFRGTSTSAPYANIFYSQNFHRSRAPAPTTFRPDEPLSKAEVYASIVNLLDIPKSDVRPTRTPGGEISHPLWTLFGRDKFYAYDAAGNERLDWFASAIHGLLLEGQLIRDVGELEGSCDGIEPFSANATRGFAAAQLFTSLAMEGYLQAPEAYFCRGTGDNGIPLSDYVMDANNPSPCAGQN